MSTERQWVRTYYRSTTPDGKLCCESRDPRDVNQPHPDGVPLTYEQWNVYEVNDGWEPWDRDDPSDTRE